MSLLGLCKPSRPHASAGWASNAVLASDAEFGACCFGEGSFLGRLGPPVPFSPLFFWEGSTKIDYRKKGSLILTSLLEDPGGVLLVSCW